MSALFVSEVSRRRDYWRNTADQPKSNLRGEAYLLIARTIQGRFWSDGRPLFPYRIMEGLPVTRPAIGIAPAACIHADLQNLAGIFLFASQSQHGIRTRCAARGQCRSCQRQ